MKLLIGGEKWRNSRRRAMVDWVICDRFPINQSSNYGLLDDQVQFLPGWLKDTLSTAPIARLAVLRLDGDLYESTWDALVSLYPKLSAGGFLIVDDYNFEGCSQAVHDSRAQHDTHDPILRIDQYGVYWRKGDG